MITDLSVKRPVLALVVALLLTVFGAVSFQQLPLREYPDIDPPVVSIETGYPGAAAVVVESRITELIEDRVAGVEGIRFIESSSQDGRSDITIEFRTGYDIDAATNDVRDRVSGILDNLPDEAEIPEITKVDSSDDVIVWMNLTGEGMTVPELTDFANRNLVDRFSVLEGVARVRVGGGQPFAMRIWLDRSAMAAREITVQDVEAALRSENVELPAGSVESIDRQLTVRVERSFRSASDFQRLVIREGSDGYLVRLGDIARVERGPEDERSFFRGNQVPQVGIGVIKQSTANTVEVARAARAERERINQTLPEGMVLEQSYDTSIFIEEAIREVYNTLFIAIGLVVLVIYLFLGSVRAMIVPAVTVPVSLVGTFIVISALGFTVNLLTLLGLVLAIGLVVDDAIVVLENISRRIREEGETPLVAAYLGARQVVFAVIATTVVLVAVFLPIAFLEGDLGRLFSEFAITLAAAVSISSFVALSLSPMLSSKLLHSDEKPGLLARGVDRVMGALRTVYRSILQGCFRVPVIPVAVFLLLSGLAFVIFRSLPEEYAPVEDRGAFFLIVNGPEGATYRYMEEYMEVIEDRMMSLVDRGEVTRLLVRSPRAFGSTESFNTGIVICVLAPWGERRSAWEIMGEVSGMVKDLPGIRAFPVMRQGFGGGISKPVQFVIGGGTYEQLVDWRDLILARLDEENPGLTGLDWDYKETKPQLEVRIDYDRAAELGVRIETIGRTLESLFGSRQVTTFLERGEEYDVIIEGERDQQRTPGSLENVYVRPSAGGSLIPLSNLVTLETFADSNALNRYNRTRAITLESNLAENLPLGVALAHLEQLAREELPQEVIIDYKGQSQDLQGAGSSLAFVFLLGLAVVFLVLAAQFESFRSPLVIMLTVPLAIFGGLAGLWFTDGTLNIYSQIGLIMLVGIAAKNGILIVEFANQLRDEGIAFEEAILDASVIRIRPILMTAITTAAGAIPLVLSTGAGSETRVVIGTVVLWGILAATFTTLFVVPTAYRILARSAGSPGKVARRLEEELKQNRDKIIDDRR